ncbi:MAG: SURF1 family protein [Janthinobacterium lividum]
MPIAKKTVKLFNLRAELLPTITTTLGVIILAALGLWQLYRLQEKNLFIASITENLGKPPIEYNPDSKKPYNKVSLEGNFLPENIYLYGRRLISLERDGYYLLTPFKTNSGEIILVARGWLGAKYKSQNPIASGELRKITGVILPLEKKKIFIPNNDLKNNVWFTLDREDANKFLKAQVENYYLLQIEQSDINYVKNVDINSLVMIKNDHLEYALTWFGLAISLIIIFIIYCKKKSL